MNDGPADRGWMALEQGTALARLVAAHPKGNGLPCCSFVAAWSLWCAGMVPHTIAPDLKLWASLGLTYWKLANITSFGSDELDEVLLSQKDPREWDSLEAALRLLGGRRALPVLVCASQPAPALEAGRWHIVQRWHHQRRSGHTYLVRADDDDAQAVTVVQSSVRLGYRVDRGTWSGQAGLNGYHVGVVVLPALGG